MREIKFRGKTADGRWVYGDLEYNRAKNKAIIHVYTENGDYYRQHTVNPETVGQYIGIKDENGQEIYEGDIVYWKSQYGFEHNQTVYYDSSYGGFSPIDIFTNNKCKVIGNIYDNPELLK